MGKMNTKPWEVRRVRTETADRITIEGSQRKKYGNVLDKGTGIPLSYLVKTCQTAAPRTKTVPWANIQGCGTFLKQKGKEFTPECTMLSKTRKSST